MRNFEVSSDSTCELYADEIKKLEVFVSPLSFTMEEDGNLGEYLDNFQKQEDYVEFYQKLRRGGVAKTSILNLQSHIDLFTEMAEKGVKNAIHISQGRGLSPTIDNALKAIEIVKEKHPDINYVALESTTTTVAEGFLVRIAVEMRDEGKTLEETVEKINHLKGLIQHFILVDDLIYLKRGGRIGGVSAAIGTMLRIKPVIEFTKAGKLEIVRKEMGSKKAIKSVMDEVKQNFTFGTDHFKTAIVHTDNLPGALELQAEIKKTFGIEPEIRIMGPIIGAHVGPNAVAWTFISNEERLLP